jgi:hypothetical protein
MRTAAQTVFFLALILPHFEPPQPQNTFQEDRHLREYLWSSSVGQFLKFEPLRDEGEVSRTIGLLIYRQEERWLEKPGCFPNLALDPGDAVTGPYSARSFRVWDRGRWPPPTPPMDVSILGSHIRFETDPHSHERLQSLELQISIPDAITYRKAGAAFRAAVKKDQVDPECVALLRGKDSYVVSELIVGREAYFYRRYTSTGLYPIKDAGPADFKEVREGQYVREKTVILAYRVLKPVWVKEGTELLLADFRPDLLRARRGF